MIIYPAIDLKGGKCVRLRQGRMDGATVYGENPAKTAQGFEEKGASWIHVVDLDGAFAGRGVNTAAVRAIISSVSAKVQIGGGIRTMEDISFMLDVMGASRAVLGSVAVNNRSLVKEAVLKYGEKIAVGIDAKNGMAAVEGWGEISGISALELARIMRNTGVKVVIYTDISRDGMMSGPNFKTAEELFKATGLGIILSGGISSMDDVKKAKEIGMAGVIIGKALYAGAVDLNEAIRAGEDVC